VPKIRDAGKAPASLGLGPECSSCFAAEPMNWMADYEAWVLDVAGLEYRTRSLEGWRSCCSPDRIVSSWMAHAESRRNDAGATLPWATAT